MAMMRRGMRIMRMTRTTVRTSCSESRSVSPWYLKIFRLGFKLLIWRRILPKVTSFIAVENFVPVLKVAEHGHDSVKGSVLHLSGLLTERLWRNYPTLCHSQVEQWRHIYFMMFISNFVFILFIDSETSRNAKFFTPLKEFDCKDKNIFLIKMLLKVKFSNLG